MYVLSSRISVVGMSVTTAAQPMQLTTSRV